MLFLILVILAVGLLVFWLLVMLVDGTFTGTVDGSITRGVTLALRSIARNPLRASLTVLGILIGVSAVVTVTAVGAGAREQVSEQISALGSNAIIVFPMNSAASGAKGAQGSGQRLTEDDGRAIVREDTSIVAAAPMLRSGIQIVAGDKNHNTQAFGTTTQFFDIRNWHVKSGDPWTEHDEAAKAKVVVIGTTVRDKLFGNENPIGRLVRIGRYPYRVLGVLEKKGEGPFGDQDDTVLMPSTSLRARIMRTPPGFAGDAHPVCELRRGHRPCRRPGRRHPAPAPPHQRGPEPRLRDPHAEGVPGDAGEDLRPLHDAPRGGCGDQPHRRRHRHHEHHAGLA